MNFLAGTGHYDDFANFDTPPTDPTFEATDVPGRYRDLIGSGPFTFSVVSNPEAGQVTDPGGTDHNQDPATGGTGESGGIGFYAPEVLDGWVLRLEIEAGDGEDVDILSFEGGQVVESDEQGDYSENLGDYIYERFEDGSASVTIYETDGAPNVLNLNFLAGTGHYDDFANFDTPPTDPTFEATDVPGRYRDLIGSGPFTFSVVSNPEAGQVTDPGGTDHNQDPATGGTGESVGIGFYAPEVLDGWVLRLEIEAGDGEDVDILSFEGGQIMESDEQGDYSVNLGDYIYERFEDGSASVTIYETDGAPNVLNLNFLAGTGHYDDFANFDTPPTDPTFEATDVPGRYRDLIGSGPFTFSVVSNPEAGQTTDPGGTDHNQDPETGGTGESEGIGFYAPEVLDGWVLRLEIEAGDGEDVDILSFEGGQVVESDEQGDYSENLGDYIYERFEDGSASVTIYETDGAPNVLNLNFLAGTGHYDDFANFDTPPTDPTFEATDVPGRYRTLIGSGPLHLFGSFQS